MAMSERTHKNPQLGALLRQGIGEMFSWPTPKERVHGQTALGGVGREPEVVLRITELLMKPAAIVEHVAIVTQLRDHYALRPGMIAVRMGGVGHLVEKLKVRVQVRGVVWVHVALSSIIFVDSVEKRVPCDALYPNARARSLEIGGKWQHRGITAGHDPVLSDSEVPANVVVWNPLRVEPRHLPLARVHETKP